MRIAALLLALVCTSVHAFTAPWSGRVEYVTTVTGKLAVKCWYVVGAEQRPVLFAAKNFGEPAPQCPATIEVE